MLKDWCDTAAGDAKHKPTLPHGKWLTGAGAFHIVRLLGV